MKKILFGLIMSTAFLVQTQLAFTQDTTASAEEVVNEATTVTSNETVENSQTPPSADDRTFHQTMKKLFLDGGVKFMTPLLICFILGLAIAIERIIYLTVASTNTTKLLKNVESALQTGGVESAKEVCRNTSGPVASIFYQGLDRHSEGLDMVEKSVTAYGNVQAGLLEKGMSWISLFIALAPMLGFFGTVIGMIQAFDAIAAANNISPGIVAGGIGVALITTVAGLVVAMILQVFYNYLVSKVDSILNDMEDASISLVDILVKYNKN